MAISFDMEQISCRFGRVGEKGDRDWALKMGKRKMINFILIKRTKSSFNGNELFKTVT